MTCCKLGNDSVVVLKNLCKILRIERLPKQPVHLALQYKKKKFRPPLTEL